MVWKIIFDETFIDWLHQQEQPVQDSILAYIGLLKQKGPLLGRPYVDTLQGSKYPNPNLKELRVQHQGQPWRILFAFDPIRQAIMLVGGNKTSDKKWYEKNIPIAEKRLEAYLKNLTEENQ